MSIEGGAELVSLLKADERMSADTGCMAALDEMEVLLKYCSLYKVEQNVSYFLLLQYPIIHHDLDLTIFMAG